jgi:hypothetical protein
MLTLSFLAGQISTWIFLGFCALIVTLQLIPAAMTIFGMAKGLVEHKEVKEV